MHFLWILYFFMYYVLYITFYVILYVTYCLYNLYKVIYATTYTNKIMNNWKQHEIEFKTFCYLQHLVVKGVDTAKKQLCFSKKYIILMPDKFKGKSSHFKKFGWVTKELLNKTYQWGLFTPTSQDD